MKFTERVTEITRQDILPSIVDFVNNSNIFTARVTSNPKKWRGVTTDQPIRIANSTTGGSFSGLDQFDTSATNNVRKLQWYVKAYEQSIVIPGIEQAVNGDSEVQVLSLVTEKMEEAKISLTDSIGDLLYGYGIGKDIEGLGLIVDDGTSTSSYGGITRADLPAVNGDVTPATNGNLSLDLISAQFDAVGAAGSVQESPTIALTTTAVWSLFESILNANLSPSYTTTNVEGYNRVTGGTPAGQTIKGTTNGAAFGADAIVYRGKPVVADDKAPEGRFYWINEHYLEFRRLLSGKLESVDSRVSDTEGVYKESPQPSFLQLRDFMSPVNQFGEIGALIVMGNLIHRNPRRNGVITGITQLAS